MQQNDYALLAAQVRRAQAGNLDAFRDLVVRYQDMAVGYAFSVLGDYHLAEDAAQEAFLAVFREVRGLRHPEAFAGWLRTVVFRQCGRIRRRRPDTVPLSADDERLIAPGASPADAVARAEAGRLVADAIGALPPGQREVVSLYYIGERSGRQVAQFLGLPLTSVKKRLHDAKPHLRKRMSHMAREYLEDRRPSRDGKFAERVLRMVSPDPTQDAATIYDLFEAEDHPARRQWREGRLADSHADWRLSRVAFAPDGDGERPVAALLAYGMTMGIGGAGLRAAGINGDALHADDAGRRLEILARAAASSVGAMREAGYDLAVTFDDEAFWLERGFVLGWRALAWRVGVADLPSAPAPDLERAGAVHRDDLAAVYNETHGALTGAVLRPTYRRNKHPGLFTTFSWGGRRSAGYVSVDADDGGGSLWVDEVAGDADTCLAVLRSLAQEKGCSELFFDRLHSRSPVGVLLRQMDTCRLQTATRLGTARWYVVRVVNLESALTKLAPVLRERLLASELAGWRGSLVIELGGEGAPEAVTMTVRDDGVDIASGAKGGNAVAGGQAIARLLVGADEPMGTVASGGLALEGEAARLLPVLFPPQDPQMDNQGL